MKTQTVRVLLIDDNEDDAEVMRRIIADTRRQDIILTHTPDEDGALELLESNKFNVIILDNRLTRLTGVELLRDIRSRGHQLPVIYCSTIHDPRLDEELRELNCEQSVEKQDLNPEALQELIDNAINR